jgi:sulfite exporter TauE/SafE
MPVNSPAKALALGAIWGWLPCVLVYSALGYAIAQWNAIKAGVLMLAFGLGTLPSVLLSGVFAQTLARWLQIKQSRWLLAVMIIVFGVWTLLGAGMHSGYAHSDHMHHEHDHSNHQESNSHDSHH